MGPFRKPDPDPGPRPDDDLAEHDRWGRRVFERELEARLHGVHFNEAHPIWEDNFAVFNRLKAQWDAQEAARKRAWEASLAPPAPPEPPEPEPPELPEPPRKQACLLQFPPASPAEHAKALAKARELYRQMYGFGPGELPPSPPTPPPVEEMEPVPPPEPPAPHKTIAQEQLERRMAATALRTAAENRRLQHLAAYREAIKSTYGSDTLMEPGEPPYFELGETDEFSTDSAEISTLAPPVRESELLDHWTDYSCWLSDNKPGNRWYGKW